MLEERALSLKQLRAFAALIREGSIASAADRLGVTAPAVSAQIKLLEGFVGGSLYLRGPNGMRPTDVGAEVLEAAQDVVARVEACASRIEALRAGAAGAVSLGVVSTAKYFAPMLVAQFQREYPGVRISLRIGNRDSIARGMEHNAFDLAIMGRLPEDVPIKQDILGDHPHVLIAASDHRLAHCDEVAPEDLLEETFLMREPGSGTRMLTLRALERWNAGAAFDLVEMGTNETIKQAVMAGLGVALISADTVQAELEQGRLVRLAAPGLPIVRQWRLIRRSDRTPSHAVAILRGFVLSRKGSYLPHLHAADRRAEPLRDPSFCGFNAIDLSDEAPPPETGAPRG